MLDFGLGAGSLDLFDIVAWFVSCGRSTWSDWLPKVVAIPNPEKQRLPTTSNKSFPTFTKTVGPRSAPKEERASGLGFLKL